MKHNIVYNGTLIKGVTLLPIKDDFEGYSKWLQEAPPNQFVVLMASWDRKTQNMVVAIAYIPEKSVLTP